jgi:hypothetical protein
MKRAHLLNCLATVVLGLPATASASAIFLVNGAHIVSYQPLSNVQYQPNINTSATFARGLAFDGSGNLYAVSSHSSNIYKYTPGGAEMVYSTSVTSPIGLAISPTGNLITSSNNVIEILDGSGGLGTGSETITSGVGTVDSLVVDAAGNLYEADDSGYINEYTYSGGTTPYSSTYSNRINLTGVIFDGMAFDASGNMFVSYVNRAQGTGGGIYEIAAGSTTATSVFSSSAINFNPSALAIDTVSNSLYLSWVTTRNGASGSVEYFNLNTTQANGQLSTPTVLATGLNQPYGLTVLTFTPEPGTIMMLLTGLGLISLVQFRKLRRQ